MELAWQEISKTGAIITKHKSFKTKSAMDKFIDKLFDSGKLYQIIGYRE